MDKLINLRIVTVHFLSGHMGVRTCSLICSPYLIYNIKWTSWSMLPQSDLKDKNNIAYTTSNI